MNKGKRRVVVVCVKDSDGNHLTAYHCSGYEFERNVRDIINELVKDKRKTLRRLGEKTKDGKLSLEAVYDQIEDVA